MSLATRIAAGRRPPDGVESGSPWIPLAVEAEYEPPHATIDPDRDKSWIARAMPVVLSHKFLFITALVTSFISLVLQVQIPKILMEAIDNSIVPSTSGVAGATSFRSATTWRSPWCWWCWPRWRATSPGCS